MWLIYVRTIHFTPVVANIRWQDSFFWQSLMFLLSFLTCFLFWVFLHLLEPGARLGAPRSLLRPAASVADCCVTTQIATTLETAVACDPAPRGESVAAIGAIGRCRSRSRPQPGRRIGQQLRGCDRPAFVESPLRFIAASWRFAFACRRWWRCARLAALRACASRCALRTRCDKCETTDAMRRQRH